MIIGITGTFGAGKGTVVEFLLKKGFKHYSVREFLTEEILSRGLEVSQGNMASVANDLRAKFGPSYIVEELYKKAVVDGGDCIIESLRCPGEVEALKDKPGFVLFAIDADVEIRYTRIVEREGSAVDEKNFSFDKFVEREQAQFMNSDPTKQNLKVCIEMADYVFKNDWTIEELHEKVAKVLASLGGEKVMSILNKNVKVSKRLDALSWDDYFISVALLSAERSKDPSTQVGACIVDPKKKIIGVGYNGFPTGCSDDELPWNREGDFLDVKYPYVCHAELNAILNSSGKNLFGASIYVALFPCNECAKAIIQSGIKEVVYLSDKYAAIDSTKASRKMLEMAGIVLRRISPSRDSVTISLGLD